MAIFESGPGRWVLEPKKALIPGSVTLNAPDHLVARPEGVRGRNDKQQEKLPWLPNWVAHSLPSFTNRRGD